MTLSTKTRKENVRLTTTAQAMKQFEEVYLNFYGETPHPNAVKVARVLLTMYIAHQLGVMSFNPQVPKPRREEESRPRRAARGFRRFFTRKSK